MALVAARNMASTSHNCMHGMCRQRVMSRSPKADKRVSPQTAANSGESGCSAAHWNERVADGLVQHVTCSAKRRHASSAGTHNFP